MMRIRRFAGLSFLSAGLLIASLCVWGFSPTAVAEASEATTEQRLSGGLLGEGERFETPYFVREAAEEGPTVLIIGGMHGNEPAGAEAADQIRHWPITRGRLVVVPRANPPALELDQRRIPDKPRADGDLNRNFPATQRERGPIGPTAESLWAFIQDVEPDWILDLHEGYDFHVRNPRSVGSTIIHFDDEETNPYVEAMLEAVNAEVTDEEKVFQSVSRGPVETGMVRATLHHLGGRGLVLESTRADQRLALRARQHRLMVHTLLDRLEMTSEPAHVMLPVPTDTGEEADGAPPTIRIALYDDEGASTGGINTVGHIVRGMADAELRHINAADIRDGALEQFDAVVFTGGRGGAQGRTLSKEGRQRVRDFIEDGGGYVGICAGAYLATARLNDYLKMVGTYHYRPWQTGRGPVEITLTEAGRELLSHTRPDAIDPADLHEPIEMRYANGPLFFHEDGREPDLDLPEFETLAVFTTGVMKDDERQAHMEGTPAIIASPFGEGRIVLISPHPESTSALAWIVEGAIMHAAEATAGKLLDAAD